MPAGQEEGHCRYREHEDDTEEKQRVSLPACQSWLHHMLPDDVGCGLICLSLGTLVPGRGVLMGEYSEVTHGGILSEHLEEWQAHHRRSIDIYYGLCQSRVQENFDRATSMVSERP